MGASESALYGPTDGRPPQPPSDRRPELYARGRSLLATSSRRTTTGSNGHVLSGESSSSSRQTVSTKGRLFRGSPLAWKRHSLAGINEECGDLSEPRVLKTRSNSVRSEGGLRTEAKPQWVLHRRYRASDSRVEPAPTPPLSTHSSPTRPASRITSGSTLPTSTHSSPTRPASRITPGSTLPTSTHSSPTRPASRITPGSTLPTSTHSSPSRPASRITPGLTSPISTHSSPAYPAAYTPSYSQSDPHRRPVPAPSDLRCPPPAWNELLPTGRTRQTSTSSEPPKNLWIRPRQTSTSSEPVGGRVVRRRPLKITVTYEEVRRERRLPRDSRRPEQVYRGMDLNIYSIYF